MWQSLSRPLRPQHVSVGTSATLHHRRIFVLPTRYGFGFGLLLVVMWLASVNYNNNLGFILTYLLASIALVSAVHAVWALNGLRLQVSRTAPVYQGELAQCPVRLHNASGRVRCALRLALDGAPSVTLELPAGGEVQTSLGLRAERRGWMEAGPVTVSTVYPLGLFRAWSSRRLECRILVYPRPAPPGRPFPEVADGDAAGKRPKPGEDEMYGFRGYQPGDSPRTIHWKGLARGQGLYTREYRQPSASELWLDYHRTPGDGIEARLSQLCRWLLEAEQGGRPYGLRLPGQEPLEPGHGMAHLHACLTQLALFPA